MKTGIQFFLMALVAVLLAACGGGGGGGNNNPGGGGSETMGNRTGFTAVVDGTRYTTFDIDYTGYPLSVGAAYLTAGASDDIFQASGGSFVGQQGAERFCGTNHASFDITLNGVSYSGDPERTDGNGNCLLTTTELSEDRVRVSVSGTFWNSATGSSVEVTDGEFQFVLERFPPGNGKAQVSASFEGLAAGSYYSNSPAPVSAGDVGWKKDWSNLTVVDVSASPLAVTPAGGDELHGGDKATTGMGEHSFSKVFDGDEVYASFLLRHVSGFSPNRRLTFANQAVYIGLHDGTSFQASIGDQPSEKVVVPGVTAQTGVTYHVVGRLYKAEGADHFNRLDIWVDPARNASNTPHATAERRPNTGNVMFLDKTMILNAGGDSAIVHLDRIRFSDTWDGLFAETESNSDDGDQQPIGSCGGGAEDTSERPSGAGLISTCAGIYSVQQTLIGAEHQRGTLTIGADNSIDFDTGASFTASDIDPGSVYDRIHCCNRIDVSFNGEVMRLHRNADGVLTHVFFRGQVVSLLPPLPASEAPAIADNVITATVDGETRSITLGSAPGQPRLSSSGGRFSLGNGNPNTNWRLQDVPAEEGTHYCKPAGQGTAILYVPEGMLLSEAPISGGDSDRIGRCTITVESISKDRYGNATAVSGRFSVELLTRGGPTEPMNDPFAIVTDGYFNFSN